MCVHDRRVQLAIATRDKRVTRQETQSGSCRRSLAVNASDQTGDCNSKKRGTPSTTGTTLHTLSSFSRRRRTLSKLSLSLSISNKCNSHSIDDRIQSEKNCCWNSGGDGGNSSSVDGTRRERAQGAVHRHRQRKSASAQRQPHTGTTSYTSSSSSSNSYNSRSCKSSLTSTFLQPNTSLSPCRSSKTTPPFCRNTIVMDGDSHAHHA